MAEYLSVASELCYYFFFLFFPVLGKIRERFGAHLEKSWFEKSSCGMANTQDISEKFKAIKTLVMSLNL